MGIYILSKINKFVHIDSHGLYRDDDLMTVPNNRRANNTIQKKLFKIFKELGFKIMVEMDKKIFQYLNAESDLIAGTVSPYTKPNAVIKYMNTKSNHPVSVIRHIPRGVECKISRNSSTNEMLNYKKKRV